MVQRIFSTLFLWSLVAGLLWWVGPCAGVWFLTFLSALAQWELYRLFNAIGLAPRKILGIIWGTAVMLMSYYAPELGGSLTVLSLSCIVLGSSVLSHRMNSDWIKITVAPTLTGIMFIPYLLSNYVEIARCLNEVYNSGVALTMVIWLIAVAKFSDIGGLLVGSAVGKHRIAPSISPKKSWEGVLGGTVLATLGGVGLTYIFKDQLPACFTPAQAFILAIILTPLAIISDLFKSVLKRQAGVKNSGNMIPGIGGALDLVDSLLFTAPIGYLYVQYFIIR